MSEGVESWVGKMVRVHTARDNRPWLGEVLEQHADGKILRVKVVNPGRSRRAADELWDVGTIACTVSTPGDWTCQKCGQPVADSWEAFDSHQCGKEA